MIALLSRSIGGVLVDVVINENHTSEVNIPEHPVERGTKISDHVWRDPREVELECIINGPGEMAAFEALLTVQEDAEPFDLVTGLKLYENMLIEGLYPIRDKTYGRVLKFNASLKEVIIVSPAGHAGGAIGGVFGQAAGGLGPFGGLIDLGLGVATGAAAAGFGAAADVFAVLNPAATLLDGATAVTQRGEVQAREIVAAAIPRGVAAAFGA